MSRPIGLVIIRCYYRDIISDSRSNLLERTVISTYGSYIAESLVDWTKNIVTLVQNDAFFPHPIRRELKPLVELFTHKNLGHLEHNGTKIDLGKMVPWLTEYYTKYCQLFDLECNVTGIYVNKARCPPPPLLFSIYKDL